MIREVNNNMAENLFKDYFPNYHRSNIYEHIIIYEEKEIMGALSYSLIYDRIEINYLLTLLKFRKKGIALKLIDYLIKIAQEKKCQNISLEVDITNEAAINLYLKAGFQKKALRKNYYQNHDAYLMVKELVVKK